MKDKHRERCVVRCLWWTDVHQEVDRKPWIGKRNLGWGKDSRVPVPGSKNNMQSEDGKGVRTLSFGINGEKESNHNSGRKQGESFSKRGKAKDFRCHKDIKQHK